MDLIKYVRTFGHLSFAEKPFGNVDATLLSALCYLNYELVAPTLEEKDKKPFHLSEIKPEDIERLSVNQSVTGHTKKILKYIPYLKRYKDISISLLSNITDNELEMQFYAFTYFVPDVGFVVAYRGTDLSVVGWKEDFEMATRFGTPGQFRSVKYMKDVYSIIQDDFIVLGHSKGANFTLYSSIHAPEEIQKHIKKAYFLDGPGFFEKEVYDSGGYLRVKDKVVTIVPYDDVVGELFYSPKETLVVRSSGFHAIQHDMYLWHINKKTGDFIYVPRRSKRSRVRHRAFKLWVKWMGPHELSTIIRYFVALFGGMDQSVLTFLTQVKRKIKWFLTAHRSFTPEEIATVKKTMRKYFAFYRECKKYYRIKEAQERLMERIAKLEEKK